MVATVSHAAWMIISKLIDDGRLMKRYRAMSDMKQQKWMTYLEQRVAETLVVDVLLVLLDIHLLVGLFHRHRRAELSLSHYYDYLLRIGLD